MNRTTLAVVLVTAISGLAFSQPASPAVQTRIQVQTGSNLCTLSVPTIDTKIRPRANGYKNEGTTNAFVICSFDAPPGAYLINGKEFQSVSLDLLSLDGVARDVTCTGVNSVAGGATTQLFVSKTLSVVNTGSYHTFVWLPADFGGTGTIPYSGGAFSVTCILPPQVSIVTGYAHSQEDVGN